MNIEFWLPIYGAVFGMNLIAALIFTGMARRISIATGFMDKPQSEAHKLQSSPVALGGGYAMMLALTLSTALGVGAFLLSGDSLGELKNSINFSPFCGRYIFLFIATALATLLGYLDDHYAMKASVKFGGQFLVALIAVWLGEAKLSLFLPSPILVFIVSILWYMFLMNAINFFDNMDGLAVGTVAIAMLFFLFTAAYNSQFLVAIMAAGIMGCCVGFWWFNKAPAKIYMGDSGSHLLGFLAALVSSCVTYFNPESKSYFPIVMPLLILALPLLDAVTVCVIRAKLHKPFWVGDHNHISHRFVKMGLSRPYAVLSVHLLCLIYGISALPLLWSGLDSTIVIVAQMAILTLFILVIQNKAQK